MGEQQFRGNVRQQWTKLTDVYLDSIAGKRDQLVGKVREVYGLTKDQAEVQIRRFEKRIKDGSADKPAVNIFRTGPFVQHFCRPCRWPQPVVRPRTLIRMRIYDRNNRLPENNGCENHDLDARIADADFLPASSAYRF